jgi:acyl carrier protein
MRLVEDLELDSLKRLTLALEVENHFQICLDEESAILTVGDLVEIIRERLDE